MWFCEGEFKIRTSGILWHSMSFSFDIWVKSSLLEMCYMCNTRKGEIVWNYIIFVLFNGKCLKDLMYFV